MLSFNDLMPYFFQKHYICKLIKLIKQNIMEKIEELIEKLDNRLPSSFAKRLNGYDKLSEKLKLAKAEHNAEPTEESTESLIQIQEYFDDITDDLIEDLEALVEQKKLAKARQDSQNENAQNENAQNQNAPQTTPPVNAKVTKEEKKKGMGVFTLVVGVVLLVGTAGAYNFFNRGK